MRNSVCDFVEGLYKANDYQAAFGIFQNEVISLGFDGVLYTYIPKVLLNPDVGIQPLYQVSDGYCPEYLNYYTDARFDKFDPLIKAVNDGVVGPIDWWGEKVESYKAESKLSREVIDVSRSYGIQNGLTIPLMCDERGVAGASFISSEGNLYKQLIAETLEDIALRTQLFHNLVVSNAEYMSEFVRPLVGSFSNTQLRYIAGLASGKKTSDIAKELGTSPGYLDQTMLKLRRKLSGVHEYDAPTISRSQVLYYAGLLNILQNGGEAW